MNAFVHLIPNPFAHAATIKCLRLKFQAELYQVIGRPLVRGQGTVWPTSGWISGDLSSVSKVTMVVNGRRVAPLELFQVPHAVEGIDFFSAVLLPNRLHFCHYVHSSMVSEDYLNIKAEITSSEGVFAIELCHEKIYENLVHEPDDLPPAKIAICMATYNPKIDLFKKQIDSIILQKEKSWKLIINDDCSSDAHFKEIQKIAATDDRIHVFQNEENLGFYYNFERTLSRIHFQYEYVALADQDDYWFESKLDHLIQNIGDAHLIYNDMRIEHENGDVISPTFWNMRSNHYKNMSALMLANTVTGSASIFRATQLNKILPFPARLGNAFHDHWLGLTAAVDNKLTYLDSVEQAYVQHDSNVTGYGQFKEIKMHESTLSFMSLQRMKAVLRLNKNNKKYIRFINNNLKVYFDAYMRRKLQYLILIARHPHWRRKGLDKIYLHRKIAVQHLLGLHWKMYKRNWMTNNAELSYINAIEVMKQLTLKDLKSLEK